MFVEKPDSDLRPHIAKILASLDDPDMTIHLLLLQAQYNFDQATDKDAWSAKRAQVVRDLDEAKKVTHGQDENTDRFKLWSVRVEGQAALVERKDYSLSPAGSEARRAKGLSALGKLNQAIKSLEASSDPQAASDAVCLRYLLGELTREFLTDTRFKEKLPSKTCTELKSSALTALGAIRPDVWSARQSFLEFRQFANGGLGLGLR